MLDHFSIFTRGGLVLWTFQISALKGSPIDALIRSCLLEERSGETSFHYGQENASYTLKWTFHNELGLVFVAVYQRFLQLLYADELLARVRDEFAGIYREKKYAYPSFDAVYEQLVQEAEAKAEEMKKMKQAQGGGFERKKQVGGGGGSAGGRGGGKGGKGRKGGGGEKRGSVDDQDDDGDGKAEGEAFEESAVSKKQQAAAGRTATSGGKGTSAPAGGGSSSAGAAAVPLAPSSANSKSASAFDLSKLRQRKSKSAAAGGGGGSSANLAVMFGKKASVKGGAEAATGKRVKSMRKWDDDSAVGKIDFSDPVDMEASVKALDVKKEVSSGMDVEEELVEESEEEEWGSEEEQTGKGVAASTRDQTANGTAYRNGTSNGHVANPVKKGWFSSVFSSVAGKAALDKSDVKPALKALKERLMTKNVAEEIAEKLCESVSASLLGRKHGSFTRISSTVQVAMEEALTRILTPKRSIDILRDVHAAKEQGRPYVIVFVGVNGVGKSTNLAKVAYWLLQHDVSVMLAACDTFRSGAVEQLRTHARRLQVELFERGYEKDPAAVANEAIRAAVRNKTDVVLVDTAGRMQDNEPLMRALSKLINLNGPDLVLFVGEALVGNDAVDQLSKFNQRLADLSTTANPQLIDGILLTKFDTIDDKVGAALSMVYTSGAPIMFVGCGQTYTDLKKLNVKQIVRSLLK